MNNFQKQRQAVQTIPQQILKVVVKPFLNWNPNNLCWHGLGLECSVVA